MDFFEYYGSGIYIPFEDNTTAKMLGLLSFKCFKTEEEAEKAYKRWVAERVLAYEIKKLNGDWKPDFNNSNNKKYLISCNYYKKYFVDFTNTISQNSEYFYLKSPEDCQKLIEICTEYTDKKLPILDWYFGIEK